MSKKFVLVPWERLQTLLALEKENIETITTSEGKGGVSNLACSVALDECITSHSQGGTSVCKTNQLEPETEFSSGFSTVEPQPLDALEGGAGRSLPEEKQQLGFGDLGFGGEKKVKSLKESQLHRLTPPGVPANRRWLTWN